MSFSADTVQAKLATLNETQETVVSVAQWLLFHKRHAATIAEYWLQRVKQSQPNRRLSLVYLVNEVAQQANLRKRDDFRVAFAPVLVEGLAVSYKTATLDVQQKLRRTVDVWRERDVFDASPLDEVEVALAEIDQARATTRKAIGNSIFSSGPSLPPDIQAIITAQTTLSSAESRGSTSLATFEEAEQKNAIANGASPQSIPFNDLAPLSADLSTLLQKLSSASVTVASTIDARQILLSALAKLTSETKAALSADETRFTSLNAKKHKLEQDRQAVEDRIQRGQEGEERSVPTLEPERPDMEPLTPPALDTSTPPGEPESYLPMSTHSSPVKGRSASDTIPNQIPSKRRKMESPHDEFAAFADNGILGSIDPDVEAMLNG